MRHLKNFVWFAIGMVLVGLPMLSFAGTYPATKVWQGSWSGCSGPNYCSSPGDACSKMGAAYPGGVVLHAVGSADAGYCYDGNNSQMAWAYYSPVYVCVNGGTLSGQTCTKTCPSGQELQSDGQCSSPCAAGETRQPDGSCATKCALMAGFMPPVIGTVSYPQNGPSEVCWEGCSLRVGGDIVICYDGRCYGDPRDYTGATCSASEMPKVIPPDSPEKKCIDHGQGFGSVNGVVVCVDATTSTGKKTDTTKTTDSAGQTTTSTTTTDTKTVKNPDGSTTTITTVTNPDGTKTETTTTTSGSANGGGNGKGDGDFGWGEPGNEGALTEKEAGVSSLTPVEIAGGASCPPPVSLPHGWGEIRYDLACSLADKVRPIVLAFAWLAAGLIVIGGVKGD